jgi:hypothetical protein
MTSIMPAMARRIELWPTDRLAPYEKTLERTRRSRWRGSRLRSSSPASSTRSSWDPTRGSSPAMVGRLAARNLEPGFLRGKLATKAGWGEAVVLVAGRSGWPANRRRKGRRRWRHRFALGAGQFRSPPRRPLDDRAPGLRVGLLPPLDSASLRPPPLARLLVLFGSHPASRLVSS